MKHATRLLLIVAAILTVISLCAVIPASAKRVEAFDAAEFTDAVESGVNEVIPRGTIDLTSSVGPSDTRVFLREGNGLILEYGVTADCSFVIEDGGFVVVKSGAVLSALSKRIELREGGSLTVEHGGLLRVGTAGWMEVRDGATLTIDGEALVSVEGGRPNADIFENAVLRGGGFFRLDALPVDLDENELNDLAVAVQNADGMDVAFGYEIYSGSVLGDLYLNNPLEIETFVIHGNVTIGHPYNKLIVQTDGRLTIDENGSAEHIYVFGDGQITVTSETEGIIDRLTSTGTLTIDGGVFKGNVNSSGTITVKNGGKLIIPRNGYFRDAGDLLVDATSSVAVGEKSTWDFCKQSDRVTKIDGELTGPEYADLFSDGAPVEGSGSFTAYISEVCPWIYAPCATDPFLISGRPVVMLYCRASETKIYSMPTVAIEDGQRVIYLPEAEAGDQKSIFWIAEEGADLITEKGKGYILPEEGLVVFVPYFSTQKPVDLNDDGQFNVLDAICAAIAVRDGEADERFDADGNGKADADDVIAILLSLTGETRDLSAGVLITPANCKQDGLFRQTDLATGEPVDTVLPMGEHAWDSGNVTAYPVGDADGNVRYTCAICGDVFDYPLSHLPIRVGYEGFAAIEDALAFARTTMIRLPDGTLSHEPVKIVGNADIGGTPALESCDRVEVVENGTLSIDSFEFLNTLATSDPADAAKLIVHPGGTLVLAGETVVSPAGPIVVPEPSMPGQTNAVLITGAFDPIPGKSEPCYETPALIMQGEITWNGPFARLASAVNTLITGMDDYDRLTITGGAPITIDTPYVQGGGFIDMQSGAQLTFGESTSVDIRDGDFRGTLILLGETALGGLDFDRRVCLADGGVIANGGTLFARGLDAIDQNTLLDNKGTLYIGRQTGFVTGAALRNNTGATLIVPPDADWLFEGGIFLNLGEVQHEGWLYVYSDSIFDNEDSASFTARGDIRFERSVVANAGEMTLYGTVAVSGGRFVNEDTGKLNNLGDLNIGPAPGRAIIRYYESKGKVDGFITAGSYGMEDVTVLNEGAFVNGVNGGGEEGVRFWCDAQTFENNGVFAVYGSEAWFKREDPGMDTQYIVCDDEGFGMYDEFEWEPLGVDPSPMTVTVGSAGMFIVDESARVNMDLCGGGFTVEGIVANAGQFEIVSSTVDCASGVLFGEGEFRLTGCSGAIAPDSEKYVFTGAVRLVSEFVDEGGEGSANLVNEVVLAPAFVERLREYSLEARLYSADGYAAALADQAAKGGAYRSLFIACDLALLGDVTLDAFEEYFLCTYWSEDEQTEVGSSLTVSGSVTLPAGHVIRVSDNPDWQVGATLIVTGTLVLEDRIDEVRDGEGNVVTGFVPEARVEVAPYASLVNGGTIERQAGVYVNWEEDLEEPGVIVRGGLISNVPGARHEGNVYSPLGLTNVTDMPVSTVRVLPFEGTFTFPDKAFTGLDGLELYNAAYLLPAGRSLTMAGGRIRIENASLRIEGTMGLSDSSLEVRGSAVTVAAGGTLALERSDYYGENAVFEAAYNSAFSFPFANDVINDSGSFDVYSYSSIPLNAPNLVRGVTFHNRAVITSPVDERYIRFEDCVFLSGATLSHTGHYNYEADFTDSCSLGEGQGVEVVLNSPEGEIGEYLIPGAGGLTVAAADASLPLAVSSGEGTVGLMGLRATFTGSDGWNAAKFAYSPQTFGLFTMGGAKIALSGSTALPVEVHGTADLTGLTFIGENAAVNVYDDEIRATVTIGSKGTYRLMSNAGNGFVFKKSYTPGGDMPTIEVPVTDINFGFTVGGKYFSAHIFAGNQIFCSVNSPAAYRVWNNATDPVAELTGFAVKRVNEQGGVTIPTKTHLIEDNTGSGSWFTKEQNGNIGMSVEHEIGVRVVFERLPVKNDGGEVWTPDRP